jgi:predicted choloylglycine hydrolase
MQTRLRDTRVLGMTDQLWGLLDGVNDRGLAASFTFGGRRRSGPGFSIPLVIRYILETCGTVEEAVEVLERVPVQGAYNVTVVDDRARHATVWVSPGEPARVTTAPATTNHQGVVEWPEHARWTKTVERLEHLQGLLGRDAEDAVAGMLAPPMHNTRYDAGFGTLYTAIYRPGAGTAEYRWPRAKWRQSLEAFSEGCFEVALDAR